MKRQITLGRLAKIVNKLLETVPPSAIVVGEAGEGTVAPITEVRDGWMYQYKDCEVYGMSDFLHADNKEDIHLKKKGTKTTRTISLR